MNHLILLIGLCAISFSPSFNTVLTQKLHYTGMQIGSARLIFAALGLLIFPLVWKSRHQIKDNFQPLLIGGVLLGTHFYFWTTSFEYISLSSAVIFLCAQPLVSMLFTLKDKNERVTWPLLVCIGITTIGLFAIFLKDIELSPKAAIGDIFVLLSLVAIVLYQLKTREVNKKLPWLAFNISVWFIGGLMLLIGAVIQGLMSASGRLFWEPTAAPEPGWEGLLSYLALVGLILICTYTGHGCYNRVIPRLKLIVINLSMISQPVLAMFIGYCIGIEDALPQGPVAILGSALTILGMGSAMFYDMVQDKKKTKK